MIDAFKKKVKVLRKQELIFGAMTIITHDF